MQVLRSHLPWKGGHYGKQGAKPVVHEVDVQIPYRARTEV